MVTARSSSGWRSISSTWRGNSSSSSRNSTPLCASEISPGRTVGPPPTSPADDTVWWGARNGRAPTSAEPPSRPADRVHHRRLQRLVEAERRQDPRQPRGEHRLAGARRADEQQVVAARGGDLQRAPRDLLPAHVGQVRRRRPATAGAAVAARPPAAASQGSPRSSATSALRFGGACTSWPPTTAASPALSGGTTSRRTPRAARPGGDRQHAAHRPQRAVERQLADEQRAVERRRVDDARRRQHADRNRHVERGAVLAQVGGRQVDGDPARRQLEPAVLERAPDAHAPLADARVGEADDVAAREARRRRRPRRRWARLRSRPRRRTRHARTCRAAFASAMPARTPAIRARPLSRPPEPARPAAQADVGVRSRPVATAASGCDRRARTSGAGRSGR